MTNVPASRRRPAVPRIVALACAILTSSEPTLATKCAMPEVRLARIQGRVRYPAKPGTAERVAGGVRVEITNMDAREPRIVATVETDSDGRFVFKPVRAGRQYSLSFWGSGASGLLSVRLDPSSENTWLTMVLDGHDADELCPIGRATVGKPD